MVSLAFLRGIHHDRVLVQSTARSSNLGARRLPDRLDDAGLIAAILVETQDEADAVLRQLDRVGRTIYLDVERKQNVDIVRAAKANVRLGRVGVAKPNSVTVDALMVMVDELWGLDVRSLTVGVVGLGNIGFKASMELAERGARVRLWGRRIESVETAVASLRMFSPRSHLNDVAPWRDERVDLMVSALSAHHFIDAGWLLRIRARGTVIDVGIDNLDPSFIVGIRASGGNVIRLDARASGRHVVSPAPGFFARIYGRAVLGGIDVVSGGVVADRGAVVVDRYADPQRVIGIANGSGGLVLDTELMPEEVRRLEFVKEIVSRRQESN